MAANGQERSEQRQTLDRLRGPFQSLGGQIMVPQGAIGQAQIVVREDEVGFEADCLLQFGPRPKEILFSQENASQSIVSLG